MKYNTCEYCGAEFQTRMKRGKPVKFCSRECYLESVERERCTCQQCGKRYKPKAPDRTTYCSRKCAFEALKDSATRGIEIVHICVCVECGGYTDRPGVYCSDECRKAKARRDYYDGFVSVAETNEYIQKTCAHCGREFEVNLYAGNIIYCPGGKCARAAERKRYGSTFNDRARKYIRRTYGEVLPIMYQHVNREKVIERDGYTCAICGGDIPPDAKRNDPMSLSIDHIIPLSQGGSHIYGNLQVAHKACNEAKGVTVPDIQHTTLSP